MKRPVLMACLAAGATLLAADYAWLAAPVSGNWLMNNLKENAIPESVVNMTVNDFDDFLAERRKLMAKMIETYYKSL